MVWLKNARCGGRAHAGARAQLIEGTCHALASNPVVLGVLWEKYWTVLACATAFGATLCVEEISVDGSCDRGGARIYIELAVDMLQMKFDRIL